MIILDTSALILFFTQDDQRKALKVKNLIESDQELLLIEPVLMELFYTLIKVYSRSRNEVVRVGDFLLSRTNIVMSAELRQAVGLYKDSNLSITDCLVIAAAYKGKIATFDEQILKIGGVKSVWEND